MEYDKEHQPIRDVSGDLNGQIYYEGSTIIILNLDDQTLKKVNATFKSVLQNKLQANPNDKVVACSRCR